MNIIILLAIAPETDREGMSLWKLKDNISFKNYWKAFNMITEEKEILAKRLKSSYKYWIQH